MATDDSWAANPRDDCYFCRDDCDVLEEHHLVPRRYGGGDEARNLVTLCPTCHEKLERLYDRRFYQALGIGEPDDVVQHIADLVVSELGMLELELLNSLQRTRDRIDGTYLDGQGINEDLHSRIETAVSAYYRDENTAGQFDADIVESGNASTSDFDTGACHRIVPKELISPRPPANRLLNSVCILTTANPISNG